MDVVDINLQTTSGQPIMLSALVVPQISTPVTNLVPATVLNYPYLQSLPLAKHSDNRTFNIDLLIGADYYWSIIEDTIIRGDGPTAVLSKLGFLLSGPTHLNVSTMSTFVYKVLTSTDSDLQRVSEYWMLESLGITDKDTQVDRDFETYRDNNITLSDGKYNASLPWKQEHPALPTNVNIANKRTRAMVRRLESELRQTYNRIIEEQETLQFIEKVHKDDGEGHYIPHHAVAKDSDTTPIRIVFDCSCKTRNQPSLNDCLETGPKLTNNMLEILLRFRIHEVAVISDIEKAFLNVKLHEKDRNFTKFFWLSDPSNPESDFIVYRFASVLFGSVSSPFILNAVLKTHLENSPSNIAQDLLQNTYVDNLVSGKDDLDSAILYYEDSVNTLAQAGFKLRSWTSNNIQLREKFKQDNIQHDKPTAGVLGLNWETDTDTLSYKPQIERDTTVCTKREVIRTTALVFDPLGFLLPVHIGAKIFIQKLWQENLDWDQLLPDELATEWTSIREELYLTSQIRMRRQYMRKSDHENSELHVFADASSRAYGVVIYLKSGRDISFVVAKPLKNITLPRLELLAAFIAAKLATFVKSTFSHTTVNITKVVLWSDSQVVLHWIHGNKKLPVFVENRVRIIKAAGFDDINYCSSKDNPADLITRGVTYKEFTRSGLWREGPEWLPNGDWPICDMFLVSSSFNADEKCEVSTQTTQELEENKTNIENVVDINRYSTLQKLLRVTALVLRFVNRMLGRKTKQQTNVAQCVNTSELQAAEELWIRHVQQECFDKELTALDTGKTKHTPLVRQFKLFQDEKHLLRCGGRLQNVDIAFDAKYPVLLPSKHPFTKLVIQRAHAQMMHSGLESTAAHIRQNYWIPCIRQVVKSTLRNCVTCSKVAGRPYRNPVTPPLPDFRLETSTPFTSCGVDFTGALFYKSGLDNDKKAYVCLFTCAVTRAIHLELVTDLSCDTFLRAFRRFAARRSLPRDMISDNGTTFVAAAKELRTLFDDPAVHSYLSNRNVKWSFIPKRAPWFGGFYERLIGVTKQTLKKTLGRALLTLDELNTVLTEVESVINDRPITYLSAEENLEPLTPSHFLCGHRLTSIPVSENIADELQDPDYGPAKLQKRAKRIDFVIQQCWQRWKDEYLPALRESHSHNKDTKSPGLQENLVRVGDVVLVHSDTDKRINWPLGIITELSTGRDGLVRSCTVRTKHGITTRPIKKLYPLEVNIAPADDDQPEDPPTDDQPEDPPTRPRRAAALQSRETIRGWIKQLRQ